jgi:hypothetical protein
VLVSYFRAVPLVGAKVRSRLQGMDKTGERNMGCAPVSPPGERRSGGIPVGDGGAVLVAYNYTPRHFPHR